MLLANPAGHSVHDTSELNQRLMISPLDPLEMFVMLGKAFPAAVEFDNSIYVVTFVTFLRTILEAFLVGF